MKNFSFATVRGRALLHMENVSCFVNLCNICEIGDGHSDECPYFCIFGFNLVQPSRIVSNQLAASISRVDDFMASLSGW